MANRSDRRWFLKLIPSAAAAVTAMAVPLPAKVEVIPANLNQPLTDEEMVAIANASAICFGLKPRQDTGRKEN